jgi:ParB/RepB/Spo0J family partition protein
MPEQYLSIPVGEIHPSPTNPRKIFNEVKLAELAASIANVGILQPVVVRPIEAGYQLVCGERRYRATLIAGLAEIPCMVRDMSDADVLEAHVLENNQRDDMHPLEEMAGFQAILDKGIYGQGIEAVAKLAERIGKSVRYVYDALKFKDLSEDSQRLFLEGNLPKSHAIELSRLSPKEQERVLKECTNWKGELVSLREMRDKIKGAYLPVRIFPFSLSETHYHPTAGACGLCPKNTAVNKLLHPDMEGAAAGLCTDKSCYDKKLEGWLECRIQEHRERNGPDAPLLANRSNKKWNPLVRWEHWRPCGENAEGGEQGLYIDKPTEYDHDCGKLIWFTRVVREPARSYDYAAEQRERKEATRKALGHRRALAAAVIARPITVDRAFWEMLIWAIYAQIDDSFSETLGVLGWAPVPNDENDDLYEYEDSLKAGIAASTDEQLVKAALLMLASQDLEYAHAEADTLGTITDYLGIDASTVGAVLQTSAADAADEILESNADLEDKLDAALALADETLETDPGDPTEAFA